MVLGMVLVNKVAAFTLPASQCSECTCILASIAPFLFFTFPGSEKGNVIALKPEKVVKSYILSLAKVLVNRFH